MRRAYAPRESADGNPIPDGSDRHGHFSKSLPLGTGPVIKKFLVELFPKSFRERHFI
ncbi:hypothetical protein [Komagataeibacter medellinensis]|uniref:hypothetical protein n=1 Tax=Komagataeibacter medellinensis TaxID=1177712 RepID=UPI0012954541|nr:hypothetical protein [Komagataeibacter medellinensis]